MEWIGLILTNKIFWSVFLATALSQLFKTFNKFFEEERIDITLLWDTGGMPSSHSAFASSLALSTLMVEGVTTLSIVTVAISILFIRDAFGIRKETGEQAKVINKIIVDLKLEKKLNVKKLKELVGHNFFQVIIGVITGIVITLSVFMFAKAKDTSSLHDLAILFGTSVYYTLPGLVANMLPILVKKRLKSLDISIDFGHYFRGRRIFGNHKTIRGFVVATFGGAIIGLCQYFVKDIGFIQKISYIDYTLTSALIVGATFGFAALTGDAAESFLKRQLKIKPGDAFIPFDQIDYILGIGLFSLILTPLKIDMFIMLLAAGGFLSLLTTKIGFILKVRKDKW
ncbi:MAG: CDP-archaeol synthase [Nanobdellota archaeon]